MVGERFRNHSTRAPMPAARKPPGDKRLAGCWHEREAGSAGCRGNPGGHSRLTKDDLGGDTRRMMIGTPILPEWRVSSCIIRQKVLTTRLMVASLSEPHGQRHRFTFVQPFNPQSRIAMDAHSFVQAAQEGGSALEAVMRTLIRDESRRTYRLCHRDLYRLNVADSDVEDCVQETFLKVWRNARSFRGESKLLTWIESIRRNTVRDFSERCLRRNEAALEDEDGMIMPDAESKLQEAAHHSRDRPDLCLERAEVRECLARRMEVFSRDYPTDVTYLVWIVIDGISNEELHKHRGGTEGATREYKSQLMKKARKIFAECYLLAQGTSRG